MKKIITSVVALLVMGSVSFAQDAAKPAPAKKAATKDAKAAPAKDAKMAPAKDAKPTPTKPAAKKAAPAEKK